MIRKPVVIFWYAIAFVFLGVIQSQGEISHTLDYAGTPAAISVGTGEKTFTSSTGEIKDKIFTDGLGREVYFRGWNVSGKVKHVRCAAPGSPTKAGAANSPLSSASSAARRSIAIIRSEVACRTSY